MHKTNSIAKFCFTKHKQKQRTKVHTTKKKTFTSKNELLPKLIQKYKFANSK